jgi:hypothetical protein
LEEKGFHVDPNLLFRSLTAIGIGSVRFREIREDFWTADKIKPAWERCKTAWGRVINRLHERGILSDDPMPTKAALATLTALADRFPNEPFQPSFYWLLQASRFGRYSGAATTALDEDLRDLKTAGDVTGAIKALAKRIPNALMSPDEFTRDYGDSRFGRFMLYLLAYRRGAQDWDKAGHRLGFEAGELLADFRPQWHHIFPRKYLEGHYKNDLIDSLANIAVIGPAINIRISSQDPMNYLDRYAISDAKLQQQLIPSDRKAFALENFPKFLEDRSAELAKEANGFLEELRQGLDIQVAEAAASAV